MQAHGDATLEVGGHQQGKPGILLQAIKQRGRLIGLVAIEERAFGAYRHGQAANMVFANGVAQLEVFRALGIQKFGVHPDHEQLAYLLFDGHLVEGFFRPLLAVAIEAQGTGLLKFFFRRSRRGQQAEEQQAGESGAKHAPTIAEVRRQSKSKVATGAGTHESLSLTHAAAWRWRSGWSPNPASQVTSGSRRNHVIWRLA